MNFTLILLRDATQTNGPYKPRTSRTGQHMNHAPAILAALHLKMICNDFCLLK